jgi:hypothetical protein
MRWIYVPLCFERLTTVERPTKIMRKLFLIHAMRFYLRHWALSLSVAGLLRENEIVFFLNVIKCVISVILNRVQDMSLRYVEHLNLNNLLCSRIVCFIISPFIWRNIQILNEFYRPIFTNSHHPIVYFQLNLLSLSISVIIYFLSIINLSCCSHKLFFIFSSAT